MTTTEHEIEKQLAGARNLYFGILKGIEPIFNIDIPEYVYHYTTYNKFEAILAFENIRLYTINNFDDKNERKLTFEIEKSVNGSFTDNKTGVSADLAIIVNNELSDNHVFIQSNCYTPENKYLWENYAENGKGVCLRLSTKSFLQYLDDEIEDFKLLPNFLKCCFISYDPVAINIVLKRYFELLKIFGDEYGGGQLIVWFLFLEYFRNFHKVKVPYSEEKEIRFVVSDNYSVFIKICSIISKWGYFKTKDRIKLSESFNKEYVRRKSNLYEKMNFETCNGMNFIKFPLYEVLEGVIIGPKSNVNKNMISEKSNRKIKKSIISKSFFNF